MPETRNRKSLVSAETSQAQSLSRVSQTQRAKSRKTISLTTPSSPRIPTIRFQESVHVREQPRGCHSDTIPTTGDGATTLALGSYHTWTDYFVPVNEDYKNRYYKNGKLSEIQRSSIMREAGVKVTRSATAHTLEYLAYRSNPMGGCLCSKTKRTYQCMSQDCDCRLNMLKCIDQLCNCTCRASSSHNPVGCIEWRGKSYEKRNKTKASFINMGEELVFLEYMRGTYLDYPVNIRSKLKKYNEEDDNNLENSVTTAKELHIHVNTLYVDNPRVTCNVSYSQNTKKSILKNNNLHRCPNCF